MLVRWLYWHPSKALSRIDVGVMYLELPSDRGKFGTARVDSVATALEYICSNTCIHIRNNWPCCASYGFYVSATDIQAEKYFLHP
jgi:hypothetical protein